MLVFGVEESWGAQKTFWNMGKSQQPTQTKGGIASMILAWATLTMFSNKCFAVMSNSFFVHEQNTRKFETRIYSNVINYVLYHEGDLGLFLGTP